MPRKTTPPVTLVVLACDLAGYGNLCEFITRQRRAAPDGSYSLSIGDIDSAALAARAARGRGPAPHTAAWTTGNRVARLSMEAYELGYR